MNLSFNVKLIIYWIRLEALNFNDEYKHICNNFLIDYDNDNIESERIKILTLFKLIYLKKNIYCNISDYNLEETIESSKLNQLEKLSFINIDDFKSLFVVLNKYSYSIKGITKNKDNKNTEKNDCLKDLDGVDLTDIEAYYATFALDSNKENIFRLLKSIQIDIIDKIIFQIENINNTDVKMNLIDENIDYDDIDGEPF